MKLTVTDGYKPQVYEVQCNFEMHVKDADSFNTEVKTFKWNVYTRAHPAFPFDDFVCSSDTFDGALQYAAAILNDRAFMKRLKEEDQARLERIAAQEAKKLEKKLAKQAKKETHEKV